MTGIPIGEPLKLLRDASSDSVVFRQCLGRSAAQVSENEIVVATRSVGTPFVFNALSGERLAVLDGGHDKDSMLSGGTLYCPRSRLLVSGGEDTRVVLWKRTRSEGGESNGVDFAVQCQLGGHSQHVLSLDDRCDDSDILVSGSMDGTARIWDTTREKCVSQLQGHEAWVVGLCHDAERQIQFTCSNDKTVICWDYRTNQQIAALGPFPNIVASISFLSTESQLFVACNRGQLRVLDTRMLFSGSNRVSSGEDESTRSRVVHAWNHGHSHSVYGTAVIESGGENLLVTSGYHDKRIKGWRVTGKCVWDWACRTSYPWGIDPFINGDPADVQLQILLGSRGEEEWQFFVSFSRFSLKVRFSVDEGEVLAWRWVQFENE